MSKKLTILASLLLTGCAFDTADDVAGEADAAVTSNTFTRAQARMAGDALAAGIQDAAARFGPVAPAAAAAPDCVVVDGDDSDPDGDSIPTNARLAVDCSARRFGFAGALTGTEVVTDTLPYEYAWAFSAVTDLHASLSGPFGGSVVMDTDGLVVATQPTAFGPYRLRSTLDVVTVITTALGRRTRITENLDALVVLRPDLTWNPGDELVAGELDAEGTWVVGIGAVSADAELSTPTPLRVTPSCNTLVTAGEIVATLSAGALGESIAVEWSGCGDWSVKYPGQP